MNVDQMLREINLRQLMEWQVYAQLEPFSDDLQDYRTAQIVAAIVNSQRDAKRYPTPLPIERFVLRWGDAATSTASRQTWQQQQQIGRMCFLAYNHPNVREAIEPTPSRPREAPRG